MSISASYELEVQLYFVNNDTDERVVTSQYEVGIISIFFVEVPDDTELEESNFLAPIYNSLNNTKTSIEASGHKWPPANVSGIAVTSIDLPTMISLLKNQYLTYHGSITTPPCR
jgi:carbonic anhydrase